MATERKVQKWQIGVGAFVALSIAAFGQKLFGLPEASARTPSDVQPAMVATIAETPEPNAPPVSAGDPRLLVPSVLPGFVLLDTEPHPTRRPGFPILPQTGQWARYSAIDGSGLRAELFVDKNNEPVPSGARYRHVRIEGHDAALSLDPRPDQVAVTWRDGEWLFVLWLRPSNQSQLSSAKRMINTLAGVVVLWADEATAGLTENARLERVAALQPRR